MTSVVHRAHFALMTEAEQAARVRRLAASRWGDHDIARLVGWRVEMVRRCLASVAAGQCELPLPAPSEARKPLPDVVGSGSGTALKPRNSSHAAQLTLTAGLGENAEGQSRVSGGES